MKKIVLCILSVLMCMALVMGLTACSGGSTEGTKATEGTAPATTGTPAGTDTPATLAPVDYVTIPESSAVDASFFNDAAFVGDSVSLKLSYYCADGVALGNAQFFTSGSLGTNNALWPLSHPESVHPEYQGEQKLIEDCVALSGAKRVYIMLGMNDLGLYGIDATVESYKTLVDRILEKSPSVQIIIESMTPMTADSPITGSLNNDVIKEYNGRLKELCEAEGWLFTDVASVMYDDSGNALKPEYCSDPEVMGIHFTEAGCEAWVNYLKTHAPK